MESRIVIWNGVAECQRILAAHGFPRIIDSQEVLEERKDEFVQAEQIVLLAELGWGGRHASEFYGFDILRHLRAELRVRCPIVVCSFLPLTYFLPVDPSKSKAKYEILRAPGHSFIQLPFAPKKDELLNELINRNLGSPLSEELLDDIVDSLCDVKGLVREIHHRLKNAVVVRSGEEDDDNIREGIVRSVEDAFQSLIHLFSGDDRVMGTKQRLLDDLETNVFSQKQFSRAIETVSQFSGDFERLAPAAMGASPSIAEEPHWKILYIDDEFHLRERVQGDFKKRNLTCVTASTAEEAFDLLGQDVGRNSITVVVSDYRLESNGALRTWQEKQGYSILKEIFLGSPNFVSFFALTAASRRSLLRVQKTYHVRVNVYSKEDVLSSDGAFNIFAESVRREGGRMFEVVCSQPQLTAWRQSGANKEPLRNYYRAHREMLDYERAESWINDRAKDYVEKILFASERGESEGPEHKYDFQAKLTQSPVDPKMLEKFRQRLIGRRIAIGLHVLMGFTREAVYFAMRKDPVLEIDEMPADERPGKKSIDALLSTSLALSLEDDIPDHLLIEERAWLSETMGYDLDENNRMACEKIEACVDNLRDDLREAGSQDEFVKARRRILNFATAKEDLERTKSLSEQHEMTARFKSTLRECWDDASVKEKQAFRSSGLFSLMKKYLGREGGHDPEYSLGTED